MAKLLLHTSSSSIILFFSLLITATITAADEPYRFLQSEKPVEKPPPEKLTHLRFYWHDVLSGANATSVLIAHPANSSAFGFGAIYVIDDAMTVAPEPSSKLVGRAQGFYTITAKEETALLIAMNLAFVEGKYNGSTITVVGRNAIHNEVREMPVVGGSGLFRMARGYALAKTHTFNSKTGDAIVEYNVFVTHY